MRARVRDAIRSVKAELEGGYPGEQLNELLRPLEEVADNAEVANRSDETLILLRSADVFREFRSSGRLAEVVNVNDEFHLRSLLPLLAKSRDFFLLALSQNNMRLLHCTDSTSGEVSLPAGTPTNLEEFRAIRQPDHVLDSRAAAGPASGSSKGITFGTSSDNDDKDQYLLHFFRAIARGVADVLRDSGAPLVVAAVDHELALYRTVNTYQNVIEPGVQGAPDGMKGGEMHRRAIELLRAQPPNAVQRAMEGFDKAAGTGHASSHAQEIVRAAYEGRISYLFVQENAEYRGNFDEVRRKVKRHDDGVTPQHDLLNEAVVQTIRHGGEALVLPGKDMPNGVPVCALFRYPAPEFQAAMRQTASGSTSPV
jgi:hypothetical protein